MVADTMDSSTNNRFLLVYGSETGQAKAIAQDIADKSSSHGLTADLQSAEGVDRHFRLADEHLLVFVSSTTGEGEPPNNAAKMLRRLKNKALKEDHLVHLRYTILGLGDTNYTNFCQCPKDFHRRFQDLGAHTFYDPGWADDGTGLDVVCDPWIEGLWPVLKKEAANQSQRKETGVENTTNAIEEKTKALTLANGRGTADEKTAESSGNVAGSSTSSSSTTNPAPKTSSELSTVASLTKSIAPLSGSSLSVPAESPPFLNITWQQQSLQLSEDVEKISTDKIHNGVPFPSATSDIFEVPVHECCRLTTDDAVKTALDVCIGTSGTPLENFRPGDAFAVVVQNPEPEVDFLLTHLFPAEETMGNGGNDSTSPKPSPETPFRLSVLPKTTKVKAEVPSFIQEFVTPRYLFENLLDIRSVPKKGFLRMLSQFCSDESENRRLLELSSKQGAKDYDAFVRQPGLGFLDILLSFSSLRPPLERIIENLPRLQARSYSISSSPLRCPGRAHFVFNVVEFDMAVDVGLGKTRRGICTGMIDHFTKLFQSQDPPCFDGTSSVSAPLHLSVFTRPNPWFLHPDNDLSRPLMMVGPGTGVAPFLGFLQHREKLMEKAGLTPSDMGETWLYFGCRHQRRDFLYQAELERLRDRGVLTHLVATFSRDSDVVAPASSTPKYVQHRILENGNQVKEFLTHPTAVLYVCGDAKNMARNVNDALIEVLVKEGEMTKMSAMKYLADLREQKRYLQDVWA